MSNPNIHEAGDLEELLSASETVIINDLRLIMFTDQARHDLRDILQRAYSIGYDDAHQDHVDGNIG